MAEGSITNTSIEKGLEEESILTVATEVEAEGLAAASGAFGQTSGEKIEPQNSIESDKEREQTRKGILATIAECLRQEKATIKKSIGDADFDVKKHFLVEENFIIDQDLDKLSDEDYKLFEQTIKDANQEMVNYSQSLNVVDASDQEKSKDKEREKFLQDFLKSISFKEDHLKWFMGAYFNDHGHVDAHKNLIDRENDYGLTHKLYNGDISQGEWNQINEAIENANKRLIDYGNQLERKKAAESKLEEPTINKPEEPAVNPPANPAETLDENSPEKVFIDNIKRARDNYANVEYREGKMMQRALKGLGLKNGSTETANISQHRAEYEKALREYKEYKIAEFKKGNPNEEELRSLLKFFKTEEAVKFYDSRTEAKMNYLEEEGAKNGVIGFISRVRLGIDKAVKKYEALPKWFKYGLAAATFVPGTEAIKIGRNITGAALMGVAGGMKADAIFHFFDKRSENKAINKVIEGSKTNENGEDKYNIDNCEKFLDAELAGFDKKINWRTTRSQINKYIAFAGMTVLGVATFSRIAEALDGGTHLFGIGEEQVEAPKSPAENSAANSQTASKPVRSFGNDIRTDSQTNSASLKEIEQWKKLAQSTSSNPDAAPGASADAPIGGDKYAEPTPNGARTPEAQAAYVKELQEKALQSQPAHVRELAEKVIAAEAEGKHLTSLKVEAPEIGANGKKEYASIWKVTKGLVAGLNPNMDEKELTAYTRSVFEEGIRNYANSQGISYSEAMARLSKIHPDTTIDVKYDATGHPEIRIDHNKVKFMDGVITEAKEHVSNVKPAMPEVSPSYTPSPSEVSDTEVFRDWNNDVLASEITANEEKRSIASHFASSGEISVDPASANYRENLDFAERLTRAWAEQGNSAAVYELGRLDEMIRQSKEHMKSLMDLPNQDGYRKILGDFFDGKTRNVLRFGGMNAQEALSSPEVLNDLSPRAKELMIGYARETGTMPKPNETLKVWTYRISKLAQKSAEAKLAA